MLSHLLLTFGSLYMELLAVAFLFIACQRGIEGGNVELKQLASGRTVASQAEILHHARIAITCLIAGIATCAGTHWLLWHAMPHNYLAQTPATLVDIILGLCTCIGFHREMMEIQGCVVTLEATRPATAGSQRS